MPRFQPSEGQPVCWNFTRGAYLYLRVSYVDDRFIYLIPTYSSEVTYRYEFSTKTLREFVGDSWALVNPGKLETENHISYEEGF